MDKKTNKALGDWLLSHADDQPILGHRNSEWCGHAPILEEDIAFANIALDEMGHAALWYGILAGLKGEDPDTYPDQIAFQRSAEGWRNIQMVELPIGDWAFSMLRQYLFDSYETALLPRLSGSVYQPIVDASAKIIKEETYHLRHTEAWVRRLGLGTEESHRRMQAALDELWPAAAQLFKPLPGADLLIDGGFMPGNTGLQEKWLEQVTGTLEGAGLAIPAGAQVINAGRETHTGHLEPLLDEMQKVARLNPAAEW